jgi:hypothetical protein
MSHPFDPDQSSSAISPPTPASDGIPTVPPQDPPSELVFTFQHAQRANFVDEGEFSKLADTHIPTQNGSPAVPDKPASLKLPSPAAAIPLGLESLDLDAPAPQTKVIPPPRNYILTKHAFKTTGEKTPSGGEEVPPGLCGFSATLIQPRTSDAANLLLIGGASEQSLEGTAWKLHVPTQKWSRMSSAAGPGAIFGHTAALLGGQVYVFGGLSYKATFNFAIPSAASGSGASLPAGSPLPVGSPVIDLEEEDEAARKRLVAAKLQAKLSGLTVANPKVVGSAGSSAATGASPTWPSSANGSPKLTDAAGSPGGGQ